MNIKIVKNKYLNALLLLMFVSAVIHMAVLFCAAAASGNLYILNYVNILGLDLFYPNLGNSAAGNAFSLIFMGVLYIIILKANKV